jgi:hypothetical protein
MTVKDIISELSKCPPDAEVTVEFKEINAVKIWPDGVVLELEKEYGYKVIPEDRIKYATNDDCTICECCGGSVNKDTICLVDGDGVAHNTYIICSDCYAQHTI